MRRMTFSLIPAISLLLPLMTPAQGTLYVSNLGAIPNANGATLDNLTNMEGDPCEILLPLIGFYMETNTVVTLTNDDVTGDFDEDYLNLIVPQPATNSTYADGSVVAATNFVAIGSSGYYGAQITVTNSGVHTVTSSQPAGVEVYGWGYHDAYGYFGGIVQ